MSVRLGLGEDIFISYARVDGAGYATALAARLQEHRGGLKVHIDRHAGQRSTGIPREVRVALRRSSLLVLLATKGALHSPNVLKELKAFPRRGWTVVVVAFDAPLDGAPWGGEIAPVSSRNRRRARRLRTGDPRRGSSISSSMLSGTAGSASA